MQKFLHIFFVVLGVIFFVIIIFLTYLYFTTNLFVFLTDSSSNEKVELTNSTSTESVVEEKASGSKSPLLNEDQAKALKTIGVDPAIVPDKFTEEQIICFEKVLGSERVAEIKAGATPTVAEALVGRGCL